MKVEIDEGSGFCFGVENAVMIAEEALKSGESVYCLGSIVHNDVEVERLKSMGLITVSREEFMGLKNCKVLIRAHGEPPSTYETAEQNNITIIDATCPIVKRLQTRIKKTWQEVTSEEGQIVLFGKEGHAEVVGLLGQTANDAILVNHEKDIEKIDFHKPVYLFSQTTMSIAEYKKLEKAIRERIARVNSTTNPDDLMSMHNTICGQVSNREPKLQKFAARHDIVVFVSGKESSNGKMLYSVCKNVNPDTYMISSPHELRREWFEGKMNAGICGATSTPKWLIENIAHAIRKIHQ